MSKGNAGPAVSQLPENPLVLIKYDPANTPAILASNATKTLARIQTIKQVTNAKQLETVSDVLEDAKFMENEVDRFLDSLRAAIERACERVREIPGYEDFSGSFTCRKWGLRSLLSSGVARLRSMRAEFLAADAERTRRENLRNQAEQDRINKDAADKAAAAAKKQGADEETIADIKLAVLSTPAPVVTSKAQETAYDAGVSVRYDYYASIIDLKKFLGLCLNNPVMLNELKKAIPEIESAFGDMAQNQKEAFVYPGITFIKKPVDVNRRKKQANA